jgi:hypothetical protein
MTETLSFHLSAREVELVCVALDSAVRACSGGDTDDLAKEYADTLARFEDFSRVFT